MATMIGPDVASVDENGPTPGWGKAVSDGHASFVICRGMEGTTPDSDWKAYQAQCLLLGIPVSSYLFLHFPKTGVIVPDPEDQVDAYISFVYGTTIDHTQMVGALDLEQRRSQTGRLVSADAWYDWAYRAWQRMRSKLGACPLVYTSAEWWADPDGLNNHAAPEMARSPGWFKYTPYPVGAAAVYNLSSVGLLHDPATPAPWHSQWLLNQYQLDAHNYPGFKSTVDLNRFNVLSLGSTGASVVMLQRLLGGLAMDGVFGNLTKAALESFQKSNGLAADGVYGPKSAARLLWRNT